MAYSVRQAMSDDLIEIEKIYANARAFMASSGNPHQWGNTYPPVGQVVEDIQKGDLYVVTDDALIHGVFYFFIGPDPTYDEIFEGSWHLDQPYGTIHRIAGDGSGGILRTAVAYCRGQIDYLRIDTHADNKVMQRSLTKLGFRRCGIIYISDGSPRIAYDWAEMT